MDEFGFNLDLFLKILILSFPFLGVVLGALIYLIVFIWRKRESRNFLQVCWEIVSLPFSFSKIFKQNQKEKNLPLYFQYFLKFTRFCSAIPYFHFFPKFLVATTAEFLIHFFTHEPLLTALIFTWSFLFFTLISVVESMHGEFEESVVTLANKVFLFSVSILFLFSIILWAFFWEITEPILNNSFFHFMSVIAEMFNEKTMDFLHWLWHLSIWGKFLIFSVISIYISSSLYLSKKGIR